MKNKQKEIDECKELLKNPSLKYNERVGIEYYLKSMEDKE